MTAIYVRLSRDDGNLESNSIAVQKQMLTAHAESQGLLPYKIYADDGWSGTTLDRPAFQELAEDIEQGRIKTVMCKDTSRLGRNYLAVGAFMEMLSLRGIRLISLSDAIDTINGEDEFSPFRNLMAEWYARDISKKIKASKVTNARNGKCLSGQAAYGYRYTGNNTWEVVEEQAAVIRRIFAEYLRGCNCAMIAEMLNAEGIPTPKGAVVWKSSPVQCVIRNQAYVGDLVQMKYRKPSFKSPVKVKSAPEDLIVTENHHEAIIDRKTYEQAIALYESTRRRRTSLGDMPPLSGYVYCSECGGRMHLKRSVRQNKKYDYLGCTPQKHELHKSCPGGTINYAKLDIAVLDDIRELLAAVKSREDEFIRMLTRCDKTEKANARERKKAEKRIEEINRIIAELYSDKVGGTITAERFAEMLRTFESEQQGLQKRLSELNSEESEIAKAERFVAMVRGILEPTELTAELIAKLIQRIEVNKDKKAVIFYNFIGALPMQTK